MTTLQPRHSSEKIDAFLPALDDMMSSGLVTIESVQVPNTERLKILFAAEAIQRG